MKTTMPPYSFACVFGASRSNLSLARRRVWFLTIPLVLLAGCGGSGGDGGGASSVPPDSDTDIVTVGTISGFGSVMSNGIRFETPRTNVRMDDEPAQLSDLRTGMVVTIGGARQMRSGITTALEIAFDDDLEGPVSAFDPDNNTLLVLGQTISFDELTVFEAPIAIGNVVQVSGQWRTQDRIRATHVYRKAHAYSPGMDMNIKGQIQNLDPADRRFTIGAQECDYSQAILETGSAPLANGLYVEVSSTSPLSNGTMLLERVRVQDRDRRIQARDQVQDRDRLCEADCTFELQGYITEFVSPAEFVVDGSPVSATPGTVYVNGSADDLDLDVKVSIDGQLDANSILIAEKIVFHLPSLVEIRADVESIDRSRGTVTALGITVATDMNTLFRDHSSTPVRAFGLEDLAVGDRIEIRACIDGNALLATRLERDDPYDEVTLKAPVESISRPAVRMLGIAAFAGENTVFRDEVGERIDADTFFDLVGVGNLVRAYGTYNGSAILASRLFLRDCEENCM